MLAKMDLKEGRITKQEFMMETAKALKMVKTATKCFDEFDICNGVSWFFTIMREEMSACIARYKTLLC